MKVARYASVALSICSMAHVYASFNDSNQNMSTHHEDNDLQLEYLLNGADDSVKEAYWYLLNGDQLKSFYRKSKKPIYINHLNKDSLLDKHYSAWMCFRHDDVSHEILNYMELMWEVKNYILEPAMNLDDLKKKNIEAFMWVLLMKPVAMMKSDLMAQEVRMELAELLQGPLYFFAMADIDGDEQRDKIIVAAIDILLEMQDTIYFNTFVNLFPEYFYIWLLNTKSYKAINPQDLIYHIQTFQDGITESIISGLGIFNSSFVNFRHLFNGSDVLGFVARKLITHQDQDTFDNNDQHWSLMMERISILNECHDESHRFLSLQRLMLTFDCPKVIVESFLTLANVENNQVNILIRSLIISGIMPASEVYQMIYALGLDPYRAGSEINVKNHFHLTRILNPQDEYALTYWFARNLFERNMLVQYWSPSFVFFKWLSNNKLSSVAQQMFNEQSGKEGLSRYQIEALARLVSIASDPVEIATEIAIEEVAHDNVLPFETKIEVPVMENTIPKDFTMRLHFGHGVNEYVAVRGRIANSNNYLNMLYRRRDKGGSANYLCVDMQGATRKVLLVIVGYMAMLSGIEVESIMGDLDNMDMRELKEFLYWVDFLGIDAGN